MDEYTRSRVENVMQMYRNGALGHPSPTGQSRVAYILCQYADMLETKLVLTEKMRDTFVDMYNEVTARSLWKTLVDWWRWRRS